jgi:hypothetical protein
MEAPAFMTDGSGYLGRELFKEVVDFVSEVIAKRVWVKPLMTKVAGKKEALEVFDNFDDGLL